MMAPERVEVGVAAWLVSRLMSPDFVSPFPPIITIPISLYRGGMVMIDLRGICI
jgi:hypothetical protein